VLAKNIKAARLKRGWSQQDLAKRLKVSRVAVLGWESGAYAPRLPRLQRLARLFNLGVEDLLA
jgi:putative transcriptional regulator